MHYFFIHILESLVFCNGCVSLFVTYNQINDCINYCMGALTRHAGRCTDAVNLGTLVFPSFSAACSVLRLSSVTSSVSAFSTSITFNNKQF